MARRGAPGGGGFISIRNNNKNGRFFVKKEISRILLKYY